MEAFKPKRLRSTDLNGTLHTEDQDQSRCKAVISIMSVFSYFQYFSLDWMCVTRLCYHRFGSFGEGQFSGVSAGAHYVWLRGQLYGSGQPSRPAVPCLPGPAWYAGNDTTLYYELTKLHSIDTFDIIKQNVVFSFTCDRKQ